MSKKLINTICGYCSIGCDLTVILEKGKVYKVMGNVNYPSNVGYICSKGIRFLDHLNSPNRATMPSIKKDGKTQEIDWDNAINLFCKNFKNIKEKYGDESLAFISTGQITTEEMAMLGATAKFGIGMLDGDGNTRQCMATSVVAYKQAFGFDAPPYTYQDLEESDVVFLIGSNLRIAHPVIWSRLITKKSTKIIVIDPIKSETASFQNSKHYQTAPKSDILLFYGIAKILIEKNWIDQEYILKNTNDFENFKNFITEIDLKNVAEKTNLKLKDIYKIAELIGQNEKVSFWWTMGVNQSHQAVRTAQAIINVALMTGNIGKPGTGANSITGQCNAMGSRLFSNTTTLYAGYDFANEDHRNKVANYLKIDPGIIPKRPSLPYHKIIEGVKSGKIKGLWIVATNPVHSWVENKEFIEALKQLEFLVVQDMFFNTETAKIAHLFLPAAGCGEKQGVFINSERRIGLVNKVFDPPEGSLTDFDIFKKIVQKWGCLEDEKCKNLFTAWDNPEAVFKDLTMISKGTPADISGIKDYEMIGKKYGIQWPFTEDDAKNQPAKNRRLFENNKFYHPDQKAKFIFENFIEPPGANDQEYPFILITGRDKVAQWHTLTRTDQSASLKKYSIEDIYVHLSKEDADKLKVGENQKIKIKSKMSKIEANVHISNQVLPGQIYIPMHYKQLNALIPPVFDPYSGEPAYKYTKVKLYI